MATKRCYQCKVDKPLESFYQRKISKDGYRTECKDCNKQLRKNWVTKEQRRDYDRKYNYGLSKEEFDSMLESQNGVCAICSGPASKRDYHVDHDHKTGKVRGILCHYCNLGLGNFKDSEELLTKAIRYLKEFK